MMDFTVFSLFGQTVKKKKKQTEVMKIMQVKPSGHSFLTFVNGDLSVPVRETLTRPPGKCVQTEEIIQHSLY